jgi:DNA-directed RNA polymerase subunit RPC12/RpoP
MTLVCPSCGAELGDVEDGKIQCPKCNEELYVIEGEVYPLYVECPECGATIEVDYELLEAYCEECGSEFTVDLLGDGKVELEKVEEDEEEDEES